MKDSGSGDTIRRANDNAKERMRCSPSREQVRREALQRSVNASDADQVLYRLREAGIVEKVHYEIPQHGGRPPNRWCVNPRLATTLSGGNGGTPRKPPA